MIKPADCFGCPLEKISQGFSISEGEGTSGVAIIGEALGWNEYIDGLPFRPHAQAGSKLEEAFREVSSQLSRPISRNNFLLYNVVNCHPPGDKLSGASYESEAAAHCNRYLSAVLNGFHTNHKKTILALGNIPLKYLTGFSGVAEEKQSITHLRGYVFESQYGLVVPGLHPAFIRRGNNHLTPLLVADLRKALEVANGTYNHYPSYPSFKPARYSVAPGLDEARSFYYRVKDNQNAPLAYDIETEDSAGTEEDERDDLESKNVIQIQFSLGVGEGIAFPTSPEYWEIALEILKLGNPKLVHNGWNFDNPILRNKGAEICGKIHDTMWMFKHWHPKLPRGLQNVASLFGFPAPWKHLFGVNLPWYGCADVDALQYIIRLLPKLMRERGVWSGYVNHVVNVNPIFSRATERGIPVSEEKWGEVKEKFEGLRDEIDGELQEAIPDEVRNIRPKRKDKETGEYDYGYVREPKWITEARESYDSLAPRLRAQGKTVIEFNEFVNRKYHKMLEEKGEEIDSDLISAEFDHDGERIQRWAIMENFKASSNQMQRYLKWKQGEIQSEIDRLIDERLTKHQGRNPEITSKINELKELLADYEIPISLKTKRPTTSKQELEEMYNDTGDPILEKVVKIRSLDTNLNNYLPNWKGRNGYVHPTYGYTAPTGQINSWRPNSQNVSKHTEYGQEMRGIVEAPSGYCFVEADKKSFHVATLGYVANDPGYIRFSQIDPHSILGSYIDPSIIGCSISLKWSDDEIIKASKEFKKRCKEIAAKDPLHGVNVRQALAKPTVLGNQLELGAKKLQRQNQRFIHSVAEAERLQNIVKDLFPKPDSYKRQIKELAFKQRYLVNEFARIQWFYDVFQFMFNKGKNQWVKKDGEGAREPIAFRVQSTAFGMITEELLELERLGVCEEHNFIVTIHDSLMFMPEIGKRDKCIEIVNQVMSKPCKQLVNEATGPEGLQVGVELTTGKNWRNMDEVKI